MKKDCSEPCKARTLLIFSPRSITCSRAGGAEIYVHEIMNRIALKGYKIFIVSSSDRRNKSDRLKLNYEEIIVSRNELLFPFAFLKFVKQIKNFDIIIENVSKFPILWPLFLSKIFRKKFLIIVHHIHGETIFKETPWLISSLLYFYELLSLGLYSFFKSFVVTVSESTKQELVRLGFTETQILIAECGANLSEACQNSIIKSKEPLIVYVGRVKRYKRVDDLIKAISIVRQKEPNIKCIVAGKSDEKMYKKICSLTDALGLKDVIKFEEKISEERKLEILKSAWVYVTPSMKEGFGISVLEAQSLGVPVVGYKVPGIVNCVKDKVTGILVPDGDFEALANAILVLIKNEKIRHKMSNYAKMWASRFNWESSAEKFLINLERIR